MPVAPIRVRSFRGAARLLPLTFLLMVLGVSGCAKQEAHQRAAQPPAKPQAAAEGTAVASDQTDPAELVRERASDKNDRQPMVAPEQAGPPVQPAVQPVPRMTTDTSKPARSPASPIERSLGKAPDALKTKVRSSRPKPAAIGPPSADTMMRFAESPPSTAAAPEAPLPPSLSSRQAPAAAPVPAAAPPLASAPLPAPSASAPSPEPPRALVAKPAEKTPAVSSPPASIAPSPRTANSDQFTLVKVYYGTDRAPVDPSVPAGFSAAAWYWFTSSVAALTVVLALCCWQFPASRALRWASACGLMATAGLGLATIQARHRGQSSDPTVRTSYSNRRGALELGICEVSIPKEHTTGVVERPSILKLQFSENPLKHVVLESVREQSPEEFYAAVKSRIDASGRKEAFVFVHGFNVSFESAARRTAQIAYDLKFDGAPMFYSWPSYGGLLGYTIDETNVVWTVPHLKQFLVDVVRQSGAQGVNLVAHSMGNRALTSALRELYYELNDQCPRFREVVLTAPDIDADVFRRDLAPAIVRTAQRVTLYASSNDEALMLSKKVHGYPRAGESGAELIVLPGMDTIDVSTVDTSLLGHSYYGNNLTVLADLFDLLHDAKPAERRPWLAPVQAGTLRYWIFKRIQEASLGQERL